MGEPTTMTRDDLTNCFGEAWDEKWDKKIGKMPETVDSIWAKVNEKLTEKPAEAKLEEKAGILGGITKMEVWDIPVGQAVVSGFVAVFASELIDGLLKITPTTTDRNKLMMGGVVKLAGAGAAVKFGKGLLGSIGSKAVALLLAYDGVRMLLPLDEWAGMAVTPITKLTGAGLGGRAGMGDVRTQAGRVVENYYKRPFVGR